MIRVLFPLLFLTIQGVALAVAAVCRGQVSEWMCGGHWVSPAVRVPVVAAAVIAAEVMLLAAAWPGARRGADWLARARH